MLKRLLLSNKGVVYIYLTIVFVIYAASALSELHFPYTPLHNEIKIALYISLKRCGRPRKVRLDRALGNLI